MALQERLSLLLVHCLGISLAISPYLLLLSEAENDTLSQGQHLQGQDLLTSKFVKKPVWVANRENPVPDSSGVVTMDSDGILRLTYGGGKRINISSSNKNVVTSAATLLDSGNLVVREVYYSSNGSRFGRVLWQSFDYPTDSFLPGMKLGMNLRTNQTWFLTSWLSDQVPAPGAFKLGVDGRSSSPELVMWRRDGVYWTSGPWINGSFANASELIEGTDEVGLEYKFVTNENEKYFTYFYKDISPVTSITSRAWVLDDLIKLTDFFTTIYQYPLSTCDQKQEVCLKKNSSECRNDSKHYFVPTTNNFIGNLVEYDNNTSLGLSDCHAFCWNNCSCHGYEALFPNGTGCSLWDDVLGLTSPDQSSGKTAYFLNTLLRQLESPGEAPVQSPGEAPVKSPAESSGRGQIKKDSPGSMKDWWWWWIGSLIAIIPALAMLLFGFLCHQRRRNLKRKQQTKERERSHDGADKLKFNTTKAQHLQLYSFLQIAAATDNFSSVNKLGQGGFGPVYKGVLSDGHHIAIKRLSRSSGQGIVEFKNEITLIAELQHMNLVKLLGCCIQQEEKMLIYEYMPNKSLDFFLFDPTKSKLLDWKKRLNIIEGIAQGLLYLHKYSRMRVIHRDLKASNILLDDEMNPKISDFGLARIFGQNENEANTNRVVGTYGYMSPEYAMNGIFSVKSDVYSFGVLLLEIVSGKKNTSFSSLSGPLSLIEHVWDLWKKGISVELMDPSLNFSCPETQMLRCIHVGLLCVQECAVDRPTMSDLIAMLTNETMCLPDPKQPAFYTGRRTRNAQNLPAENKSEDCSVNRVSMSVLEAR